MIMWCARLLGHPVEYTGVSTTTYPHIARWPWRLTSSRFLTWSTIPSSTQHAILSHLSINTKRQLSTYLKGRTASCRYNFTLSLPAFCYARVRVTQVYCISPALYKFFVSSPTNPSPTNLPTPMQMTSRIPIPTLTFLKWLKSLLFMYQCWDVGEWIVINHICSKTHHRPFHSAK